MYKRILFIGCFLSSLIVTGQNLVVEKIEGKWQVSKAGEVIDRYDYVMETEGASFLVKKNYQWGLLDSSGQLKIPVAYDRLIDQGHYIIATKNGKTGLLDYDHNILVELEYQEVQRYSADGTARVKKDGQWYDWNKGVVSVLVYDEIYRLVDVMPRFPGCENEPGLSDEDRKACADKKMLEFIYRNLKYPAPDREQKIEGTSVISFVVEKDGSHSDHRILHKISSTIDEEALRVVKAMPNTWTPGRKDGKLVAVQFTLPIKFKLQ